MEKIILSLIIFIILILPIFGYSQSNNSGNNATDQLINQFNTIISWVYTFFFGVAILFIIISGYYFVTASGDTEKINKAKNLLLWAVIGVIVVIGARGLVEFIRRILT
jgi:uncharacterized BrkB/YihY/UPF0761 family membrane protein